MAAYTIKEINLGQPSYETGHVVYSDAVHIPTGKKVIYKQNKHGIAMFSHLEESFTKLAQLFLFSDLTSPQDLVVGEDNNVLGLVVEHFCYSIEKKEGLEKSFYTLNNPLEHCETSEFRASTASEIPIYFLNKLPQGFFAKLSQDSNIKVDHDSLASILATSYTLEEDDLHKGNFGFYLVEKNSEKHAVFFKIDHDLMFVDSLMGFHTRRPFHLFRGPAAFDIHGDDLLSFPNLRYSANSYWPTKFGYLAHPFDNKEFHSYAEVAAFADLAASPNFVKAKWKSFYKHILIPTALIEERLKGSVDMNKPIDRAHVAVISQAMSARLAHLRAVLFSIKDFRDEVMNIDDESFLREVGLLDENAPAQIEHYRDLCTQCFDEGDTPLHTAIKLGEYRYVESIRMFGQFINVKNAAGKTPLDVALELDGPAPTNISKDMKNIMKHLLGHGARKTKAFTAAHSEGEIEGYVFPNPYFARIALNPPYHDESGEDFKNILRDIGEDHTLCLKYKKNRAIECITQWIKVKKNEPGFQLELEQLKSDINNQSSEEEAAGLKYIRQLRSKLWVIRQLRGLYGATTTQSVINDTVNQALEALKPHEPGCFSFFYRKKEAMEPEPSADLSPDLSSEPDPGLGWGLNV